jgi:hypothetical protein
MSGRKANLWQLARQPGALCAHTVPLRQLGASRKSSVSTVILARWLVAKVALAGVAMGESQATAKRNPARCRGGGARSEPAVSR